MGNPNIMCDDGISNLGMDFDAKNISQSEAYLCCESVKLYEPRMEIEPIITEFKVPPAYVATHKCMSESITYDERLPTL